MENEEIERKAAELAKAIQDELGDDEDFLRITLNGRNARIRTTETTPGQYTLRYVERYQYLVNSEGDS